MDTEHSAIREPAVPAAAAPRPASSGPTQPMIGHGAGPIRRASLMSTHPSAKPNGPSPILKASREFCRSMVMPVTANSPTAATSALHSAGRMYGAASMSLQLPVRRRSPAKRSNTLPRSIPSRRTFVVVTLTSVEQPGNREAAR
jgi:hypothetical protein